MIMNILMFFFGIDTIYSYRSMNNIALIVR